jgi:hypothetical protein
MKQFLQHQRYILVFLGILVSLISKADTWDVPKVKTYYSENMEYKLIITPRIISDKYYIWRFYSDDRHPQTKKFLRKKDKFMRTITPQDTVLIPCTAELYRINGIDSIQIWRKSLLNNICPVHAIVSNDGSSISTFDNWYSIGYGANVFVVYNEKGEAKKTYKLDEITPFPLNDYYMTISSLHWLRGVKFIDNVRIEIILKRKVNYNRKEFIIRKILNLKNNEQIDCTQRAVCRQRECRLV